MKVTQCNSTFYMETTQPLSVLQQCMAEDICGYSDHQRLAFSLKMQRCFQFSRDSMKTCKAAVLPKAATQLLDYLLLISNSYSFSAVTKLLTFLNSYFYLSHHLRMPSAVYHKYIQLPIAYFFGMFSKSVLVGLCFSFWFIFLLFIYRSNRAQHKAHVGFAVFFPSVVI